MAFVEAVTLSTRDIALVPLALGCQVVGWRTDNFNFASQSAIERVGAQKDGVMYSMRAGEWPEAKPNCCICWTSRAELNRDKFA